MWQKLAIACLFQRVPKRVSIPFRYLGKNIVPIVVKGIQAIFISDVLQTKTQDRSLVQTYMELITKAYSI